jgi:exoribonuclease R
MPRTRRRAPVSEPVVGDGLAAVRAELDVPTGFPPEVEEEAAAVADRCSEGRTDRRDLAMVTIDPPGSTDLDQALAIDARPEGGHVVWYAIADVAAFVRPGGAIDRESWRRGVTLYAPDERAPLHPPALSEGAASLLAGQDRPVVLWRLVLDAEGQLAETGVDRAMVRSRQQLSYEEAQQRIDAGDAGLSPLRAVGEQRMSIERARGGLSLPVPDQEVFREGDCYRLRYRANLPVEEWNAQLSLLCGMAAAQLMLESGWGLLRTLPPAPPDAMATLRRAARVLGVPWSDDDGYGDVVHRLDTRDAGHAAFAVQATRLFRGADLLALRPGRDHAADDLVHAAVAAPYAHVTAPLRRLADRYATEAVLATADGGDPPDWVRDALDELPEVMRAANSRAGALDRAVVDHFEALVLSTAIGDELDAVVVDRRGEASVLQLTDPPVVATVGVALTLGDTVRVRVVAADPVARSVQLEVV